MNQQLASEWHAARNGQLVNCDEIDKSSKLVWWQCSKVGSHVWQARIRDRVKGSGCPYCSGHKASKENSLRTHFPKLSEEWHPFRNRELTPDSVTRGSCRKVWWKCAESSSHEWQATIYDRTKGSGCPFCSGRRATAENSLHVHAHALAEEWHYSKNSPLKPEDVTPQSNRKVWWQCKKERSHIWQASIQGRFKGNGCPFCSGKKASTTNSLGTVLPRVAAEWHAMKNGLLTPFDFTHQSGKKAWWQCKRIKSHEWEATIHSRAKGSGCPHCRSQTSSQEMRILAELRGIIENVQSRTKVDGHEVDIFIPDLNVGIEYDGAYYHGGREKTDSEKNQRLENAGIHLIRVREAPLKPLGKTSIASDREGVTKQVMNEIIREIIANARIEDVKLLEKMRFYKGLQSFTEESRYKEYLHCSISARIEDSLGAKRPDLSIEWHPSKNYPLEPCNVSKGSHIIVWWQCKTHPDHVWEASIKSRALGNGCPYCSGRRVSSKNALSVMAPHIACEWHPAMNGELTPNLISHGSNKRVWWQCPKSKEHVYQAIVANRTKVRGTGCPFCSGKKVCSDNCLETLFPSIAVEFDGEKNAPLTSRDVTPFSHREVWWRCLADTNHSWRATIASRTRGGRCPSCDGQ